MRQTLTMAALALSGLGAVGCGEEVVEPGNREADPALAVGTGYTGGRIVFMSTRDGNPEIYVMNADGTGSINLTNHPAGDLDPDW
jgi:hypothetical protein